MQVPVVAPTVSTKLLVSPDGAVLNAVQGPAHSTSPGGLSAGSRPLVPQVLIPTGSTGRVLPSLASDRPTTAVTQADTGSPDL